MKVYKYIIFLFIVGHLFQILLSPIFFSYHSINPVIQILKCLIFYFPSIILHIFYWSIFPWYICKSFLIFCYSNFLFFLNFIIYFFKLVFHAWTNILYLPNVLCCLFQLFFYPMYFGLISIIFLLLFIDDNISSCIFLTVFSIWSFIIICSSK